MNILFLTYWSVVADKGGTERATCTLAKELKNGYGVNCYSAFIKKNGGEASNKDIFENQFILSGNKTEMLRKIIVENDIDVIINQGLLFDGRMVENSVQELRKDIRKVLVIHYKPGKEVVVTSPKRLIKNLSLSKEGIINLIKLMLYPLTSLRKLMIGPQYSRLYKTMDNVVLLDEEVTPQFKKVSGIVDESKIKIIPNGLSFEKLGDAEIAEDRIRKQQQKRVLIVARMMDYPKNIKGALRIWERIERAADVRDWHLDIVGDGPDLSEIMEYAKSLDLKRVNFHGHRQSRQYYRASSCFMLTSFNEGFPLVLLEAQQMGCVPVVFDSFPTAKKIVEDKENGRLIPPFDEDLFSQALLELMRDSKELEKMSANGISSAERYSPQRIARKWMEMFNEPKE